MTTYKVCGRDIVRRYVGAVEAWGHTTNPGPNHHDATPSRSVAETGAPPVPDLPSGPAFVPVSRQHPPAKLLASSEERSR